MKLSNKQYDIAKKWITLYIPALITLISVLGVLYGFDTTKLTGTIAALDTFAGTILGVSSKNYHSGTNG